MQKKITIAIFAICFMALVVIISSVFSLNDDFKDTISIMEDNLKKEIKQKHIPTWNEKLAKVKTQDYHFAINNLFIQIDLKKEKAKTTKTRVPKIAYQLLVDNDRYSSFCVQKTLESFSLPYLMVKQKDKNFIIINSYNTNKIQKAIDTLKQYNINSTLKKVTI